MENISLTCGGCSTPYDTNDHIPRTLINCAHNLCSYCLNKIISPLGSRKCPFDNLTFDEKHDSIEKFPVNSALLALIQKKNQEICSVHEKKLTVFCLQDKVKICSDCESLDEHRGHRVQKIEELRMKGMKMKKDLQERLMKFKKSNQDLENTKKRCFNQMGQKFGEINKIVKVKKQQWRKQMEDLFGKSGNESSVNDETYITIEEIDQACQNEENLTFLDQDFSSIISRLQPRDFTESCELLTGTKKIMDCIESFLATQAETTAISKLPTKKTRQNQATIKEEEKQQPLPPVNITETKQILVLDESLFLFAIHQNLTFLRIWVVFSKPNKQVIDLDHFKDRKQVCVELRSYDLLFQYPKTFDGVSHVLEQFKEYTSLTIEFQEKKNLTDDRALFMLNYLFPRVQDLEYIEISFTRCEITNQPVLFFCTDILPKAVSLKGLTLKLTSTLIDDFTLFALAQALSTLSKTLDTFGLEAAKTAVTDEGTEKLFHAIEGVKELNLYLSEIEITDRSLKVLEPSMKNLKVLDLDVSETQATLEGIDTVFTGVPKDIRELSLTFYGINLSDELVSLVEEKLCPKLESVESLYMDFENSDLKKKVSAILSRVKRDAQKRRRKLLG